MILLGGTVMVDGYLIFEFGVGFAGYAIAVPTHHRRREKVNMMARETPPNPPAPRWRKGDGIDLPGIGTGVVHEVGNPTSKVKIGDTVPFDYPTRLLRRRVFTPRPTSLRPAARRRITYDNS